MGRLEYLERRCRINEEVLHDLGQLVAAFVPQLDHSLTELVRRGTKLLIG